ncbi:MAG: hypothetical protein LQ347_005949, partial [Umbilicaria vellea]
LTEDLHHQIKVFNTASINKSLKLSLIKEKTVITSKDLLKQSKMRTEKNVKKMRFSKAQTLKKTSD